MSHRRIDSDLLLHLLTAVGQQDAASFRQMYRITSPYLLAILLRLLANRDRAEDALQETFIRIWNKASTFDPARGDAIVWMAAIARNQARDALRARKMEDSCCGSADELAQIAEPLVDPCQQAQTAEGLAWLEQAMQALTPDVRRSLLLVLYEGRTHRELAQCVEAPLGTAKSWVRRGLEQLRQNNAFHQMAVPA